MKKYLLNRNDLLIHLGDQIGFIINSAIAYDNGVESEAKRLATHIRTLVHDTSNCSALLTQLKKMGILFFDSASVFDPRNPLTLSCLLLKKISKSDGTVSDADYFAPLDNLPPTRNKDKKIGFNRWWRQNVVFKDKEGNTFYRKDIILSVADKDGGAHVDSKLDDAYANLTRFNSLGWKLFTGSDSKDMGNPVPPSIRQITHEVIKTLKEGILDLFSDKTPITTQFEIYEKHCNLLSKKMGFIKEDSHAPTSG